MALAVDSSLKSRLAEILVTHPIMLAYLYGSAAAGRATPLSDVDIALVASPASVAPTDRLNLELKIESEIAQRCHIRNADVRIINLAPLRFRGEVVTKGRLLFERDKIFRVDYETRTRSQYFDFLPVLKAMRTAHFKRLRERGLNG